MKTGLSLVAFTSPREHAAAMFAASLCDGAGGPDRCRFGSPFSDSCGVPPGSVPAGRALKARRFSAPLQILPGRPGASGSVDRSRPSHRFFDLLAQLGKPVDHATKIAGRPKEPLQGCADHKIILASLGNGHPNLRQQFIYVEGLPQVRPTRAPKPLVRGRLAGMTSTGMSRRTACAANSMPDIPGSTASSITTSGRSDSNRPKASSPVPMPLTR